jgi:hypothetical protein
MKVKGRAQAVTVISPARPWWAIWLRLSWIPADRTPLLKRTLVRLAFIHVAHWSLVERIPSAGGGKAGKLPRPYLLFQSNFDDDLAAYVDAFALIVPWRMRLMWHGIYGFPGPAVVDRFLTFVESNATAAQHYFCAYPQGSSRTIAAALELSERHAEFSQRAGGLDDEQFAEAFAAFVHHHHRRL